MSSWSRRELRAGTGALLAGWLIAAAAPRDFPVGTFVDDAQYAVLAKSLREGRSYRVLSLPDRPPETKFPPGFPAVLAAVWSPGSSDLANLDRARYVNLVLLGPFAAALAVAGVTVFGLTSFASVTAALAGLVTATSVKLWTMPMSEPLSLGLVALGFLAVAAGRWRSGVTAASLAVLVRTLALPFLVAMLAVAWRRRGGRREAAHASAIAAALVLPWFAWLALHHGAVPDVLLGMYGSYGSWYADALRTDPATLAVTVPVRNVTLLARATGDALAGWDWLPWPVLAALGAVVIGLVAGWRFDPAGGGRLGGSAREGTTGNPAGRAVVAGLGLYAAAVVLWPFPQAERFVGGVWPLVLLAAVAAVPLVRLRLPIAAAALALALVGFVRGEGVRTHRRAGRATATLMAAIRPMTAGSRVLSASDPPLYYLSLGIPAVPNQRMRSYRWYRQGNWGSAWGLGDDLWDIVERYRPQWLVVERRGSEGRWAAGSLMRQCPGVLTEVWRSSQEEFLFAVSPDVPCTPAMIPR